MYIVKDLQGDIVAITSRLEDAQSFVNGGKVDKTKYKIYKDKDEISQKTN
jgi:hypothetical protein